MLKEGWNLMNDLTLFSDPVTEHEAMMAKFIREKYSTPYSLPNIIDNSPEKYEAMRDIARIQGNTQVKLAKLHNELQKYKCDTSITNNMISECSAVLRAKPDCHHIEAEMLEPDTGGWFSSNRRKWTFRMSVY